MTISFNLYPTIHATLGIACLLLGSFILLKNKLSFLNQLYFTFCFGIALWMIPMSQVSLNIYSNKTCMILSRLVFTSVIFLPTIALHFTIEYLKENITPNILRNLKTSYLINILFLISLWFSDLFVTGIRSYSWGSYPLGGILHFFHSLTVITTAFYMDWLQYRGLMITKQKKGKSKKYHEQKYVVLAFLSITFATIDFFPSWNFDIFPIGFIFVSFFIISTSYAIFKHELLGISIVIKKSLIYSILISLVASFYFISVYIIGTLIGGITKAQEPPVILFILAFITLVLKPIENKVQKIIESIFYKPRDVIEKENALLLNEAQKNAHLRSVATLAAGMAHEIKNPLTSIKTFAEYLPSKYHDPEFRSKFSRIVTEEVDRVNHILRQLLEFSKPSAPVLKPTKLHELLDETLALLNENLVKKSIELSKDYSFFPAVNADKNQLKQVFLNIFLNAIQSISTKGTLNIKITSMTDKSGFVLVSISDTGSGMTDEQLKRVFDPFYTTREDGTGLGLAITHSIIEKHKGLIDIQSTPGKGTTVNVFLKNLDGYSPVS